MAEQPVFTPAPTPAPAPAPVVAAPSAADKVATWFDSALAWVKARVMSFLVGGGLGFLAPKILSLLGL